VPDQLQEPGPVRLVLETGKTGLSVTILSVNTTCMRREGTMPSTTPGRQNVLATWAERASATRSNMRFSRGVFVLAAVEVRTLEMSLETSS
jgi:hypothetical protein